MSARRQETACREGIAESCPRLSTVSSQAGARVLMIVVEMTRKQNEAQQSGGLLMAPAAATQQAAWRAAPPNRMGHSCRPAPASNHPLTPSIRVTAAEYET